MSKVDLDRFNDFMVEYKKEIAKDYEDEIEKLSKKSEILEENNKLLIQQKSQLYKDLDIAYERIDKAIEYLESYNTDFKNCRFGEAPISIRELGDLEDILKGGKDNE